MKLGAARLEALTWTLIYAGLLAAGLGIALERNGEVGGRVVMVAGALAVAIGIVLIWVRSRLHGS